MRVNTTRLYGGVLRDLAAQERAAAATFQSFHEYALSIGCEHVMDEVICKTAEQSRKLARWWSEHHEGRGAR